MKIVVLEGSPNKKGSSNLLADCFRQGRRKRAIRWRSSMQPTLTFTPAPAASTAGMKAPVSKKMM